MRRRPDAADDGAKLQQWRLRLQLQIIFVMRNRELHFLTIVFCRRPDAADELPGAADDGVKVQRWRLRVQLRDGALPV